MAEVLTLQNPDRKGPSGYSVYCKVCWFALYILWVDETDHEGACMHGAKVAADCPDAMSRARQDAHFAKLKAMGFSGVELFDPANWQKLAEKERAEVNRP